MSALPSTDLEGVQVDVWSLVQLLDTLAFLLQGMTRDADDKEQDQADGLAWCALRMAQKMDRDIDVLVRDAASARRQAAKDREDRA